MQFLSLRVQPSAWWRRGLFAAVMALGAIQILQSFAGILNIPGIFGINFGPTNDDLSSDARILAKPAFISQNSDRCQNKLGMAIPYDLTRAWNDGVKAQLENDFYNKMRASGMRYTGIDLVLNDPSVQLIPVREMIRAAYVSNLTPVINLISTTLNPTQLAEFYTQLSVYQVNLERQAINPFVAATASRELLSSGATAAMSYADQVAEELKDNPNIFLAPPLMEVTNGANTDQFSAAWNAGLADSLSKYDTVLIDVANNDTTFYTGESLYYQRAYYAYAELEGGSRFTVKQALRDYNARPQFIGGLEIYPQMQAIVYGFDQQGGTDPDARQTFLRLEYDFGQFSDDPTVAGVVMPASFTVYASQQLFTNVFDYFERLNLNGTNCNYDIVRYSWEKFRYADVYKPEADVPACGLQEVTTEASSLMRNPDSQPGKVRTKFVCFPSGDNHICNAEIKFTLQVGMPVRHCGSNSVIGTNSMPFSSLAAYAVSVTNDSNSWFNQFAGELEVPGLQDSYMVPWLGNCLNTAGEALKAYFGEQNKLWQLAYNPNYGGISPALRKSEKANELTRLTGKDYASWSIKGFSTEDQVVGQADAQQMLLDEDALVAGSKIVVDQKHTQAVRTLSNYDPDKQFSKGKVISCDGDQFNVYDDPQNMVYGSEVEYSSKLWQESGSMFCYKIKAGEFGQQYVSSISCSFDADVNPASSCFCNDGRFMTEGAVRSGTCKIGQSEDPESQVRRCIRYTGGASGYEESSIWVDIDLPTLSAPTLKNGYEALNTLNNMADRVIGENKTLLNTQNTGWRGEMILRAYAVSSQGDQRTIRAPRQNNMLEYPLADVDLVQLQSRNRVTVPKSTQATSTEDDNEEEIVQEENISCNFGANLAVWAGQTKPYVDQMAKLGYQQGLTIISGRADLDGDLKGLMQEFNSKGVTPVIRSCTSDCGFTSGEQQANYINANIIANLSDGQEAYIICGHNEPDSEFNNDFVAEGQWAAQCLDNINRSNPNVKVLSTVFNATHPQIAQQLQNFKTGLGDRADEFDCITLNTYTLQAVGGTAAGYYEQFKQHFATTFGSTPSKLCVTETGVIASGTTGVNNNTAISDAVQPLLDDSSLEFALGFNIINANGSFASFSPADSGAGSLSTLCGIKSRDPSTGVDEVFPVPVIPNTYYKDYPWYLADGDNWKLYEFYFPRMGNIDTLTYNIVQYGSNLTGGEFSLK